MPDLSLYLQAIDAAMRTAIQSHNPWLKNFYEMMHYHLGWADENFQSSQTVSGNSAPQRDAVQGNPTLHGAAVPASLRDAAQGKRLRPIFCLLACETLSGQFESALPAAAAIEILHNFSLVHDDIEDGDERRRHRPTLWKLVGVPHAINVGDALFALAQQELLRLSECGVASERVLRCTKIFQQTCIQLVEGQYLDMRGEQLNESHLAYYKQMVSGKTAALLGAATAMGAAVVTDDTQMVKRFREFGIELGLTFQITDDLLGLWGDPVVTGKPAGADLQKKKKSLPVVLAQAHGGELSITLQKFFNQTAVNDGDIAELMQLMDDAHIRAQAEQEAEKHRHRATRNLKRIIAEGVASEQAAQTLAELAASLTRRDR